MEKFEWIDEKHIYTQPRRKPKKITGTRFAAILGLNPWLTPFETWCNIMHVYEKPFAESMYTKAGKTIEPKQALYAQEVFDSRKLQSPADILGPGYFGKTRGDFFPEIQTFGGMWDYLFTDESQNPEAVLEMKTTKRKQDWEKDIPVYYALQASLYAALLGVDDVYMVASFLKARDYLAPDEYVCSADNTIIRHFKVSERFPGFEKAADAVQKWWDCYVEGGISPPFDEEKDAAIVEALRT